VGRTLYGLVEKRPGLYHSRDGRFRVVRHEASGRQLGGLGYNAWRIFSRLDQADAEGRTLWGRVTIGGRNEWETLRAAAHDLGRSRQAARNAL
jgi:hypothetical protein